MIETALHGPPVRYEVLDARELEGGQLCAGYVQVASTLKGEALQRQAGSRVAAFTANDKPKVVEAHPDAVSDVVVPRSWVR